MSPNAHLAAALIDAGWTKIQAGHPSAYRRDGAPYLTWVKGPVTIASSATERRRDERSGAVEAWVAFDGASVTIEVLHTQPSARGSGHARQALGEWVALAGAAGVTLYLEPCRQEQRMDQERLVGFYKAAGFQAMDPLAFVMVCKPSQLASSL